MSADCWATRELFQQVNRPTETCNSRSSIVLEVASASHKVEFEALLTTSDILRSIVYLVRTIFKDFDLIWLISRPMRASLSKQTSLKAITVAKFKVWLWDDLNKRKCDRSKLIFELFLNLASTTLSAAKSASLAFFCFVAAPRTSLAGMQSTVTALSCTD